MRSENRPALEWRLRVVAPKHTVQAVCVASTYDREGQEVVLMSWQWDTGRPTTGQLQDLTAWIANEVDEAITTHIGVQGSF